MNYPEVVNIDFTEMMRNGITTALKGINRLESLSSIDSRFVNVFHILRGGLNFQVSSALNKAFGYKWHSSSYISSQRVLQEGKFEISEDFYRKFIIPDQATIYTADIVASGVSLDNSLKYVDAYLDSKNYSIRNFIFITIGCMEAEKILRKWHRHFTEKYPGYSKTILCYLEGMFALATRDIPLHNVIPDTDLLRNYKLGALLTPEFEHSQFEKMIIALEACVIYDGGKKGFEPLNHITDILEFWDKQLKESEKTGQTIWGEYNARFPLDHYFENIAELRLGSPEDLKKNKEQHWEGIEDWEYEKLFSRFKWLWDDSRSKLAKKSGSLSSTCRKKIKYLNSLLGQYKLSAG
jgi:hypothetical protein